MYGFDQWHDFLRVVIFAVSLYSVVYLLRRFPQSGQSWNPKTKDYWFALLMWSIAGCAFTIQGVILDRPFTPATVFLSAAVLVTGRGLHRKGGWGPNAA